jgi:hypothetical protein
MSVSVSFAGVTYDVPEEDDSGWADLTSYLVALAQASVGTVDQKSIRIATSTPVAVSATEDYGVGVNVASPATVNLPSGTTGQIIAIFDASGDAANSNITVNGDSGQTINGLSSYIISVNGGAVILQFGISGWFVLAEKTIGLQNQTNLSLVDLTVGVDNTGVSVSNLESATFTFLGSYLQFSIEAGDKALLLACDKNSNTVNALGDTESLFLPSDSGTGIVVTKSSNVVTVKNRLGGSATFKIKVLAGKVSAATAWS